MTTKTFRIALLAAALLLAGNAHALAEQVAISPGKTVEILAMGPMFFTQDKPALMLKYQTATPMTDMNGLQREVDDLWDLFVVNVDHGGYASAIISANEPPEGFIITHNDSYNFIFKKIDGSWRESEQRGRVKLDNAFVTAFMARLDGALGYGHANALLLYLANDWTLTALDNTTGKPVTHVIDHQTFAATQRAMVAAATAYRHRREILRITIDKTGRSAEVVSRETEQVTLKGKTTADTERSIDTLELHGDFMLWKKSTTVLDKQPTPPGVSGMTPSPLSPRPPSR